MTSIYPITTIKNMARSSVERNETLEQCPFPVGSSAYDHFAAEFHRVQIEQRAEVES